jgi:signal transduction histidine kinase/CheY-like chemotaxis protein
MAMATAPNKTDAATLRETAHELRAETLPIVAAATVLMAVGWFLAFADPAIASSWSTAVAVLMLGVVSYFLARWHISVGAGVLILTQVGGITEFALNHPEVPAAHYYAVPVLAAGLLFGPIAGVGTGLASTILILWLTMSPEAVSTSGSGSGLLLTWLAVILAWAASYPVYTAVSWAWTSYREALQKTEDVRNHQAELARAVASLNETCFRLDVANHELARARAAAEEARQLKAEFAANISHELRTPLNLIIGFSEIILRQPTTSDGTLVPPSLRADVDVIYRNARHLSSLIDDVLDLSQVDAGRMGLTKERADLTTIVDEAIHAVIRIYEARGLQLTSEVSPALPSIFVDRTRIRQVLINLLNNAARFTETGGTTVRARVAEGNLIVEVADTGVGIAPSDIPKVFEEFRQLDGSTRRPHDGSGLGLAICRRFVEMHGGAIWAESAIGHGTTFSFSLPIIDNVASASLRSPWETWVRLTDPENPEVKPVILVNRDARVERLFRRYLEGYQVIPIEDEGEAIRRYSKSGAQGIVVIDSPNADRDERRRRLREAPRNAPVFSCSLPTSVSLGEQLGVSDYLVKPISRERLLETLGRVARKAKVVLIADDDPDMVRLLARLLRSGSRRYQVLRAYSGREALDLAREHRPDVVVLDLVMPDVDGYAVIRGLRETEGLHDLPIVAVTARSYEADTVAVGALEITREGGLTIGELMACLRSSLDAMSSPRSGESDSA